MTEKNEMLPKMWQVLFVLGGFLVLAFIFISSGIGVQLALFGGWFLAFAVGKSMGMAYIDMEKAAIKGIANGMNAILILLTVGALIGTWISGGIVPSFIYYGLQTIHPSIFLLATLLITSITSLTTGTSWGSAGTAGIAMMGIGAGLGMPPALTAGAVLSGAYFGDKLSPVSDSTILTATMSNVDVIDHVKAMVPVTVPAYVITSIAFTIVGFRYSDGAADLAQVETVMGSISTIFNVNLFSLIPMALIITLLVMKKPAIPVIAFGAFLGIVWGVIFQGLPATVALTTAWAQIPQDTGLEFIDNILSRGGMASMLGSLAIIIFGLGFGGLLGEIGVLKKLTRVLLDKWVTNAGTASVATIITGFFGNFFGSGMYVALILTPKIMSEKIDELGLDRRVLSRNSEFGSTLTSGMVPWSDNGVYMAGILGVSTLEYLPFMWLAFSCIIISIFYGFTNRFLYDSVMKEI